ncbi:CHAT domain-containing protein [Xylogone sp. PMI_703]|nr:CHAT domain-containing protein [Xylogone sp. PMI_703]
MDFERAATLHGTSVGDLLSTLAVEAYEQYERTHELEPINNAVRFARGAVLKTSSDDPDLPERQNELGVMLESRYERTGSLTDLEEAIKISRQSIMSTSGSGTDDRAMRLNNLGNMLESLFEETAILTHLESAIEAAQEAIDQLLSADTDQELRASLIGNLGNKLRNRHEVTGDIENLEEAVRLASQALELTPEDGIDRAAWTNSLGVSLAQRFELSGDLSDLDKAIQAARDTIQLTEPNDRNQITWASNLSSRLYKRYCRTGDIKNLTESIQTGRYSAVEIPHGHPERANCLTQLANALGKEFERTGELAVLEEAIEVSRQAIDGTPEQHQARLRRLHNLGNRLESHFERKGSVASLQEAITIARQVVEIVTDDHPDGASFLASLSNKLERQIEVLEDAPSIASTLDTTIEMTRQAIKIIQPSRPEYPSLLNDLARKLAIRYERASDITDLEEAIQTASQARTATAADDFTKSAILATLGDLLEKRFRQTGSIDDKDAAIDVFYEAWHFEWAVPFNRIVAAGRCLKLLVHGGKIEAAARLGMDAIDFLPTTYTVLLDRSDEQFAVEMGASLATDTCAVLLANDQVEDALQYLERGRAVIISKLLDHREDVSELMISHPTLARQYQTLVEVVNAPPIFESDDQSTREVQRDRRKEQMNQLDACIKQIRDIKAHERFLLGQATTEMQEAALGGIIVVINATDFRSDAIIVTPTNLQALSLPPLPALLDVKNRPIGQLIRPLRQSRLMSLDGPVDRDGHGLLSAKEARDAKLKVSAPQMDDFSEFLEQLWRGCVKPVFNELGLLKRLPGTDLRRVWWIGTGTASSLPFHAAGLHSPGSVENTLSWAISSYTPSIKALRYTSEKASLRPEAHGVLLVTMPETPGYNNLPGVIVEARAMHDVIQPPHSICQLDFPSKEQVLASLGSCSIVHFACHGGSDLWNPSNSCLMLRGPSESPLGKLTVKEIMDINLGQAWLAYLSACSTAQNEVRGLADEQLHLASSFQVAGFSHVVASLWPSRDAICAQVASTFYQSLMTASGIEESCMNRAVAESLHKAVIAVREQNADRPYLWAQYIHSGA